MQPARSRVGTGVGTKNGTNDFANFTRSYMQEGPTSVYAEQREVAAMPGMARRRRTRTGGKGTSRGWGGDAGYIRLQTALVQRIFRRGVGPGRILRVARSQPLRIP